MVLEKVASTIAAIGAKGRASNGTGAEIQVVLPPSVFCVLYQLYRKGHSQCSEGYPFTVDVPTAIATVGCIWPFPTLVDTLTADRAKLRGGQLRAQYEPNR